MATIPTAMNWDEPAKTKTDIARAAGMDSPPRDSQGPVNQTERRGSQQERKGFQRPLEKLLLPGKNYRFLIHRKGLYRGTGFSSALKRRGPMAPCLPKDTRSYISTHTFSGGGGN